MRTFLKRVGLFAAIQLVIGSLIILNALNQPRFGFLAAFEDKLSLLEAHDEPHLIFVGGSNAAFGIDSKQLEQELGLPVINAGMHGALGLQICLDVAETYARPGDVIVLMPEWSCLSSRLTPMKQSMQDLLRQSPSAWQFWIRNPGFHWKSLADDQALSELAYLVQSGLKSPTVQNLENKIRRAKRPGTYSRLNFNSHGDFVGHHGHESENGIKYIDGKYFFDTYFYTKTARRINACAKSCAENGATMYMAYCPVPDEVYQRSESSLNSAHEFLLQHLDIPIIHPPAETRFPVSFFYDTICHLNLKGRAARTRVVISSLEKQSGQIAERKTENVWQ